MTTRTVINVSALLQPEEGALTKKRMENVIAFCNGLAEVYLTVPVERQPTLTDTLYKAGNTTVKQITRTEIVK